MKKLLIILFLFLNIITDSPAQKNYNNWIFGDGAWINFPDAVSDPSFVERTAIDQVEGCATYSDDNGNLLFYTDGMTVWNNNHNPIINGTGLKGSWTSFQGAYIFRSLNNPQRLFIISIGSTESSSEHIYFSIIDFTKGYDRAEIINKNQLITFYNGERAAVIRKVDNTGYWLILDDVSKPNYKIFSVDDFGFTFNSEYTGNLLKKDNHGQIKISKNGNLIVSTDSDASQFELCRFDPYRGIIYESSVIKSSKLGTTVHGDEFSPNSNYLYLSSNKKEGSKFITILNQFEIIEYFKSREVKLNTIVSEPFTWRIGSKESIQIGPNNKIYIASPETNYISSIENPNLKYPNCNYNKEAVNLRTTKCKNGLPSILVEPIVNYTFKDTIVCEGSSFEYSAEYEPGSYWITPQKGVIYDTKFTINNFSSLDTGFYHLYDRNSELRQVYQIDYISNKNKGYVKALPDNYFCRGDSVQIKVEEEVEKIIWDEDFTSRSFYVKSPGKYKFTMYLKNGCIIEDEINLYLKNIKPFINYSSEFNCEMTNIVLHTNEKYYKYEWSDGSTNDSLIVTTSGNYWVKVISKDGCVGYDTVHVDFYEHERIDFLPDSLSFCDYEAAEYRVLNSIYFKSIDWSNGQIGNKSKFSTSGEYSAIAIDHNGCPHYDTVYVIINESFDIEFVNYEKFFCDGDSAYIEIKDRNNTIFSWFDSSYSKKRFFSHSGTFTITALDTVTGCFEMDSINIKNNPEILAEIDIIGNNNSCSGEPIVLKSHYSNKDYKYYWNGAIGLDSLVVLKSNIYNLLIVNKITGCRDSTSVTIEFAEQMEISIIGNDICKGEETTINVVPYDSTLTYKWSTGESTPSINVSKAGKYSLIASNGICSDTAEIVINEYATPTVSILGETEICYGTNTTLSTNKEFEKYLWSTGETTESIEVEKPGLYKVEVTDYNGCKADAEFEVKLHQINIGLSKNSIDFGKLYIGDSKLESITIFNYLDQEIRFDYLQNKNIILKDEFIIKEHYKANELGEYQDTIWFNITYPCDSTFFITKKAEVYAIATVSTIDIHSQIGEKINIPFYIKGPSQIGSLNFEVKTDILKTLFYANNGQYISANATITPSKTKFYSMPGILLLTDVVSCPIDYVSITSDNKYVEFENIPGKISVDSICVFDFRDIINVNNVEIITSTLNGNLNILLKSVEPSKYRFEVYNLEGSLLISQTENILQLEYEKQIGTKQLSPGVYILRVSSPYKSITRKILITD